MQHTFFCTQHKKRCADFFFVVLHDYNVKLQKLPSYTFYGRNVVRVLVPFFFHCRSFLPWWPLAFLIFLPPLQNFHVVLPTKNVSFVFYLSLYTSIALFLVELHWPAPNFSFSLSFSCSIFQICGHDN